MHHFFTKRTPISFPAYGPVRVGTVAAPVGAIDAVALGPFKKQAHGHGRESEKSLLSFGCDFSGCHNFCCRQMSHFKAKMHQIRFRLRLCTGADVLFTRVMLC